VLGRRQPPAMPKRRAVCIQTRAICRAKGAFVYRRRYGFPAGLKFGLGPAITLYRAVNRSTRPVQKSRIVFAGAAECRPSTLFSADVPVGGRLIQPGPQTLL